MRESDDAYENVPGRHRFGEQVDPLSERDWRWVAGTAAGLLAFWAGVIWLVAR